VFASFSDHLSDFLQPDFRFGILLSFIATISWAFEVYTLRKAATFNPYFSLGTNVDFKLHSFAVTVQLEQVNLMSIPAISWWSIAYLVIIGSVLSLLPTSTCYKIFQQNK
jgi:hypothetical protein